MFLPSLSRSTTGSQVLSTNKISGKDGKDAFAKKMAAGKDRLELAPATAAPPPPLEALRREISPDTAVDKHNKAAASQDESARIGAVRVAPPPSTFSSLWRSG